LEPGERRQYLSGNLGRRGESGDCRKTSPRNGEGKIVVEKLSTNSNSVKGGRKPLGHQKIASSTGKKGGETTGGKKERQGLLSRGGGRIDSSLKEDVEKNR